MTIRLGFCILVTALAAVTAAPNDQDAPIRFSSPNGRFALRISETADEGDGDRKIDLIEKASDEVVADLGTAYDSGASRSLLVWSADSKWVACGTGTERAQVTTVYLWTGSAFKAIPLPEDLPGPNIKFPKGADGAVKNYGGGEKPVRWLRSGDLELSSESVMMSRVDDLTYTGTVLITIAFDAKHQASIKTVGKTKTRVE